jgi:hypothetical protein
MSVNSIKQSRTITIQISNEALFSLQKEAEKQNVSYEDMIAEDLEFIYNPVRLSKEAKKKEQTTEEEV